MKQTTICIFCLLINCLSGFGQIIINHLHTDITALSEYEINEAKSLLHIAYGHTSHGSQLTTGMTDLVAFANGGGKGLDLPEDIFAWNNGGTNGALDLHDYAMGGDVGYYPQWVNNTTSYLGTVNPETGKGTTNPDVNVIMWSWCGQVDQKYATGTLYSQYLEPMHVLETTYPNVKFVYMTGHLDHWDDENNKAANDSIRRHCQREGKILYDFADIESYDPDGNYFEYAHDNCDYYNGPGGSPAGNWATEWRAVKTEGIDWYSCSSAHSDALNANQKAYAAWALFVGIAQAIKIENIPETLNVNDTIIGSTETACFNATETITVAGTGTVIVEPGASANFIAGQSIRFLPGFHAQAGSTVNAWITTTADFCPPAAGGSQVVLAGPVVEKSIEEPELFERGECFAEKSMKVYPNPNKGQFTISLSGFDGHTRVLMYNTTGQLVLDTNAHEDKLWVELPNVQRGIYFVRAINRGKHFEQKVVVR